MILYEQMLTENECFLRSKMMVPAGVMVHSTGANNPKLSRYVPGNDEIGRNTAGTHWNVCHPGGKNVGPHTYQDRNHSGRCDVCGGRQVCVHAFIGKRGNGSVAAVQTLPWNIQGWHAGGSANRNYISFEICEDGLDDPAYFAQAYRQAVELTAMLCTRYDLDPFKDGVVICHSEGHQRGLASNHADVMHWFPRFGKSMDDFRADTAKEMEEDDMITQEQFDAMMDNWLKRREEEGVSSWARSILSRAVADGITDGTRPRSFATREECAVMICNGTKEKKGEIS